MCLSRANDEDLGSVNDYNLCPNLCVSPVIIYKWVVSAPHTMLFSEVFGDVLFITFMSLEIL